MKGGKAGGSGRSIAGGADAGGASSGAKLSVLLAENAEAMQQSATRARMSDKLGLIMRSRGARELFPRSHRPWTRHQLLGKGVGKGP